MKKNKILGILIFEKGCEQTTHTHVSIYLLIIYNMNIKVKEYLQSKHMGYIQKYHVRRHAK